MRTILWVVLALFSAGLASATTWESLIADRQFDELVRALDQTPLTADQGQQPARATLDWALLNAPPKYLTLFLAHGFDPNALEITGGFDANLPSSRYERVSFLYRVVTSSRTDLLPLLRATPEAQTQVFVTASWQGPELVSLRAESLGEAALRMGYDESLAWAKQVTPRQATTLPVSAASVWFTATLNDDKVRLREGPTTSSKVLGTLATGQKVTVLEAGPPRFLDDDPWIDRWFRVNDGTKVGWLWGGFLELPYSHGTRLAGALLVDFRLMKQHLYQDVWSRAQTERWHPAASLWQWALPRREKEFLTLLRTKAEPSWVKSANEYESVVSWLLARSDVESLEAWADSSWLFQRDSGPEPSRFLSEALLRNPEKRVVELFRRAGFSFERMNTVNIKTKDGDQWFAKSSPAFQMVSHGAASQLIVLIRSWRDVNNLNTSWSSSASGLAGVHTQTLLDAAIDRADERVVQALRAQGARTREEVLAAAGAPPESLRRVAVARQTTLRVQPGAEAQGAISVRARQTVILIDQGPRVVFGSEEGRWYYAMTETKQFGWVWQGDLTGVAPE